MTFFSHLLPFLGASARRRGSRSLLQSIAVSVALGAGAVSSASADQWTHVSGEKTIEAKFVGVMGERAILEMPDGKRSAVALRDLQYESRQRALDMEQARQEHMATLAGELKRAAEKERELAPKQIPPPESSPPEYEPLPENLSLEQFTEHTTRQLLAGHLRVMWDGLPPSYQADVEEVVIAFANEMDPVAWQDMLGSVNRITELLASRERWIFSYPAIAEAGADESFRDGYRAVLGSLQTVFDPDVVTLERLQEGNLDELIAERDALLAGYLYSLIALADGAFDFDPSQIEVKMIDDNRGTVAFKPSGAEERPGPADASPGAEPPGYPGQGSPGYPGQGSSGYPGQGSSMQSAVQTQTFVLVEGRWVSEEIANEWDEQIAALQEQINNELPNQLAEMRSGLEAFKALLDQYLGPLEEAESQAEFHASIDRLAGQAAGVAMQAFGGMNRGNQYGGGSFGSAMGMEDYGQPMEMEGYGQGLEMEGYGEVESYGEEGYGGGSEIPPPR